MKARVIAEFVDKYSGVLHENGSTFECSNDRFAEIEQEGHYVVAVIEKKEKSLKERK